MSFVQKYFCLIVAVVSSTALCDTLNPPSDIDREVTFSERTVEFIKKPSSVNQGIQRSSASNSAQAAQTVVLKTVRFEGNGAITNDTLETVAAPFLSRPIVTAEIEQLRIALTRAYTDRGYLNSGVVLPSQKVENGNIRFEVIEGKLGDVQVSGTGRLKPDYVSDRLLSNDASNPFNSITLQNNIQFLLNDPLIENVDVQLVPTAEPGITNLNLLVKTARPYEFSIIASNHSAPSVGEQQVELKSYIRNLSGNGDQLNLDVSANVSRLGLTAAYSTPVNRKDTRLGLTLSSAGSGNIEEAVRALDLESKVRELVTQLNQRVD